MAANSLKPAAIRANWRYMTLVGRLRTETDRLPCKLSAYIYLPGQTSSEASECPSRGRSAVFLPHHGHLSGASGLMGLSWCSVAPQSVWYSPAPGRHDHSHTCSDTFPAAWRRRASVRASPLLLTWFKGRLALIPLFLPDPCRPSRTSNTGFDPPGSRSSSRPRCRW